MTWSKRTDERAENCTFDSPSTKAQEPDRSRGLAKKGCNRGLKYTPEILDEIVERISLGEPLRQICRDNHMPHWTTVYDWIRDDEAFALRIARARDLGFDAIAEETLEIADDSRNDYVDRINEKTGQTTRVFDAENVQRSKLRIETRLKLLAKWSPRKYGDRTAVELTGADGGPVQINDTERASRITAILAIAEARRAIANEEDLT